MWLGIRGVCPGCETDIIFGPVLSTRGKLGLTREGLANDADLHRTSIGLLEVGKQNLSFRTLRVICGCLSVALVEMLALVDAKLEELRGEQTEAMIPPLPQVVCGHGIDDRCSTQHRSSPPSNCSAKSCRSLTRLYSSLFTKSTLPLRPDGRSTASIARPALAAARPVTPKPVGSHISPTPPAIASPVDDSDQQGMSEIQIDAPDQAILHCRRYRRWLGSPPAPAPSAPVSVGAIDAYPQTCFPAPPSHCRIARIHSGGKTKPAITRIASVFFSSSICSGVFIFVTSFP